MGRKSKLTDAQWAEVERRMLEGEPTRALAREFGVSEAAIRARKSAQVEDIKSVANQIVAAERAVMALPFSARISAQTYAARLRAITDNMLAGAELLAANFHRLSALAQTELAKVDDAEPMTSAEHLKSSMILTKAANESAVTPVNLVAANKDRIKQLNEEPPPESTIDPTRLSDTTLQELLEARG